MERLQRLAVPLLLFVLAACNYPLAPPTNPLQTAIAATLNARPLISPTPPITPTSDPAARPAGKIVYVCQYSKLSGRNQICLINADGSDQRVLTQGGSYDDFFPSVAPDGESVVFASSRTGRFQIYELNLESGALSQITYLPNYSAYAPEISPDGSLIVFYARVDGLEYPQSHSIWIVGRDGSNPMQVTSLSGGGWDPVWSPDGTQIQFASEISGIPQLFRVDVDGSDLFQITKFAGIRGRNDWSNDGLTLATYRGSAWNWEIYFFNLNGEDLRQMTFGDNNLAPSFSPDAQWITFLSYRDHPRQDLGCEIYIMRVDGSDATRLTDNDICDWQPRWGP